MEVETKQGKKELKKVPEYKLKKDDVKRLINYATKVPSAALQYKKEVKNKITTAVLAAFEFIIGLVWRDVIREGVDYVIRKLGIEGSGYGYVVLSAFIVTIVCVIGIMLFSRWSEKK